MLTNKRQIAIFVILTLALILPSAASAAAPTTSSPELAGKNWCVKHPGQCNNGWYGQPWYPYNPVYYYPSFWISAVVRNGSVTVVTNNLPAGDQFDVLMGPYGTLGINGYYVTSFNTGGGGSQTLTFPVPGPMYGAHRIAIRMQSNRGTGFYAFNWFYNNTAY